MLTSERAVEAMAQRMANSDLWPGAWIKMPEAEREVWRYRSCAALAALAAESGLSLRDLLFEVSVLEASGKHANPSEKSLAALLRVLAEALPQETKP